MTEHVLLRPGESITITAQEAVEAPKIPNSIFDLRRVFTENFKNFRAAQSGQFEDRASFEGNIDPELAVVIPRLRKDRANRWSVVRDVAVDVLTHPHQGSIEVSEAKSLANAFADYVVEIAQGIP